MINSVIKFIRELRLKNHLSQDYVADYLGLSRPTYILIEQGKRELTITEARKLASLFGLTLEQLLGGTPSGPKVVLEKAESYGHTEKPGIRIVMKRANVKKFKEVLLYVLNKIGARPNIGETALYKILYFIDFDYYEKYEEQLTGARYIRNHHGPTPVEFKNITEEMEKNGEIESVKSKYFQYPQKKYLPLREPDLSLLSAREIKHIDEVLARLADKNARELTEHAHSDTPWLVHKDGEIISYETVFYRDHEHSVRNYEDEL
jgi:transcriptional regulator with XRE-family HTH domain